MICKKYLLWHNSPVTVQRSFPFSFLFFLLYLLETLRSGFFRWPFCCVLCIGMLKECSVTELPLFLLWLCPCTPITEIFWYFTLLIGTCTPLHGNLHKPKGLQIFLLNFAWKAKQFLLDLIFYIQYILHLIWFLGKLRERGMEICFSFFDIFFLSKQHFSLSFVLMLIIYRYVQEKLVQLVIFGKAAN